MRILVIAPQPFFSPRGTPLSVYYRTLVMAEMGTQIDLLTYGEGQNVVIPGVTIHRIPRFRSLGNVQIGPSPLKMFLDLFLLYKTIILLCKNDYGIVHAHEEAVFFCLPLKPLFNFKLVYDMHSSLPQQLTNFQFTTFKPLINLFKYLEDKSLKLSDAIITICPDLYDYVNSVISDKHKHVLIENSIFEPVKLTHEETPFEAAETTVVDTEKFISDWKERSLPIVVYAGTLEAYQGIDTLIRSFSMVLQEIPEAKLLIVGGTTRQVKEYSILAQSQQIDSAIRFTGRVPQEAAQMYTRAAKVQVSPRSTGTNTPLKIYEQLASGIPLVATNIYSHTQAIDNRVAFLVAPHPEDMARGIINAISSESLRISKTNAARALYATQYARPIYESKLKTVIAAVASQ